MKLLIDENLSDRIVAAIIDLYYPGSTHIKTHTLEGAADTQIWRYAQEHDYTIVSKDSDFHQRSLLHGAPPKVIFLKIGNAGTQHAIQLLRSAFDIITAFAAEPETPILILS